MTHLTEVLRVVRPDQAGFARVVVWCNSRVAARIEGRPWLTVVAEPRLDRSLAMRVGWQRLALPRRVRDARCDLLFAPGATLPGGVAVPVVTMSRNLLPFEPHEARRFGLSLTRVRYRILRWAQSRMFERAAGVIFLTDYARRVVTAALRRPPLRSATIPHGVDDRFRGAPRDRSVEGPLAEPLRVVYVSIINWYKHQWHVAAAAMAVREAGLPIRMDFVGPAYGPALRRFQAEVAALDPAGEVCRYLGPATHEHLPGVYRGADVFVFASSCENMPNILLEAMATGLPIACSRRGPMPEVLGDAGVYFDPEDPRELAEVLLALGRDAPRRAALARAAAARAASFSWEQCAARTFAFLREIMDGAT